jgi:WD40 repeat protein
MQDRFPQVESRGAGVPSSVTTQSLQRPAAVTPIAEIAAHRGAVTGLAYSNDGRTLVTTGEDATLKVWDSTRHSLVRTIELDDGRATSLALDGGRALTGHANGRIVLWDLERAQKLASVQRNVASIWSVAFTGDADKFAAASHDWKIALWDARQPSAPLHVLEGHENAVQALAHASGPMPIASGGADKTVRLWDATTLDLKRTYRANRDFVTAVAFSPNGRMLAGGALDGRIQVWSSLSSRRLRSLSGHRGRIASVAFSPVGQLLASASDDGTVRLWDLRRGRTLRTLTGHAGGATAAAFSPGGDHMATASLNGVVRLWAMPFAQLASD